MSAYLNLDIEMLKNRVTSRDLAQCLGKSYNTVRDKLTKHGRLTLDEAEKIRSEKFPNCTLDYLFAKDESLKSA